MEVETSLVLKLAYQDATSRNYTLSGVSTTAISQIKNKVIAINANMPENFARTFVSDIGARCVMISSARLVTTEEEVIYSAS